MKKYTWILFLSCGITLQLCASELPTAHAQRDVGRTSNTGDWDDGLWIDSDGNAAPPTQQDNVILADSQSVPGSWEPVNLELVSQAVIQFLQLGNTAQGNLTLKQDASLTASQGIKINNGQLLLQQGAELSTTNFALDGPNASALFYGDAQITNVSARNDSLLVIGADLDLGSGQLELSQSTLQLDANLTANSVWINGQSAVVNRSTNTSLNTSQLLLTGSNFAMNSQDAINDVTVSSGGEFQSFSGSQIDNIVATFSTATLNADTTVDSLFVKDHSHLLLNGPQKVSILTLQDSKLWLDGDLSVARLYIRNSDGTPNEEVHRISGNIDIDRLVVKGANFTLSETDRVNEGIFLEAVSKLSGWSEPV